MSLTTLEAVKVFSSHSVHSEQACNALLKKLNDPEMTGVIHELSIDLSRGWKPGEELLSLAEKVADLNNVENLTLTGFHLSQYQTGMPQVNFLERMGRLKCLTLQKCSGLSVPVFLLLIRMKLLRLSIIETSLPEISEETLPISTIPVVDLNGSHFPYMNLLRVFRNVQELTFTPSRLDPENVALIQSLACGAIRILLPRESFRQEDINAFHEDPRITVYHSGEPRYVELQREGGFTRERFLCGVFCLVLCFAGLSVAAFGDQSS